MNTSTRISIAYERACKSMPSSFGSGFLCENRNHSRMGLGAHLVENPRTQIPAHTGFVLLAAEPTEYFQYGGLGWVDKDSLSYVGSISQKFFGFGHGTVLALCS